MSSQIFVGNLPWSVADEDLVQFFSSYGEVENGRVIMDRETGRSRGFGFVTFTSEEAAEAALKADGEELKGRPIRVNAAEQKPRRPNNQRRHG